MRWKLLVSFYRGANCTLLVSFQGIGTKAHSVKTATTNIFTVWKHDNEYPEYFSTSVAIKTLPSKSSKILPSSLAVFSHLFGARLKLATCSLAMRRTARVFNPLDSFSTTTLANIYRDRSYCMVILIDSHEDWMLICLRYARTCYLIELSLCPNDFCHRLYISH
jgi:hypothetical protein